MNLKKIFITFLLLTNLNLELNCAAAKLEKERNESGLIEKIKIKIMLYKQGYDHPIFETRKIYYIDVPTEDLSIYNIRPLILEKLKGVGQLNPDATEKDLDKIIIKYKNTYKLILDNRNDKNIVLDLKNLLEYLAVECPPYAFVSNCAIM